MKTKLNLIFALGFTAFSMAHSAPTSYECSGTDTTMEEAENYKVSYTVDVDNKALTIGTQAEESPLTSVTYENEKIKIEKVNSLTTATVANVVNGDGAQELKIKTSTLVLPTIIFGIETVKFKTTLILTYKRINKPADGAQVDPNNQEGLLGALSDQKAINLECTATQALN